MIESKHEQSPREVASYYDDLDHFYRDLWGLHIHHGLWLHGHESLAEATEGLIRYAFADVRLGPGVKMCDIGCGYGETARWLARMHGVEVVGYTVSAAQYEHARRLTPGDNPRFLLQDWLQNSEPEGSFDVVFSIESSEHMPDLPRFFAECVRTLKPGGRFVLCTWLSREAPSPRALRYLLEPICSEGRMRMGTESEYRALMHGAGLRIDRFTDVSAQVARTWTVCILGLLRALATRREYRAFVLSSPSPHKAFALTVARIRAAYVTGAMRYGIFSATRR
jgi:tocopherol O-methyltransferase